MNFSAWLKTFVQYHHVKYRRNEEANLTWSLFPGLVENARDSSALRYYNLLFSNSNRVAKSNSIHTVWPITPIGSQLFSQACTAWYEQSLAFHSSQWGMESMNMHQRSLSTRIYISRCNVFLCIGVRACVRACVRGCRVRACCVRACRVPACRVRACRVRACRVRACYCVYVWGKGTYVGSGCRAKWSTSCVRNVSTLNGAPITADAFAACTTVLSAPLPSTHIILFLRVGIPFSNYNCCYFVFNIFQFQNPIDWTWPAFSTWTQKQALTNLVQLT